LDSTFFSLPQGSRTAPKRTDEQKADIARFKELTRIDELTDQDAAELGRLIQKLNATL